VKEIGKRFGFYSHFIAICPEQLRSAMAELLMRFSATIFNGSFMLDFETGPSASRPPFFIKAWNF
jgi:hypothetical protein